MRGVAPKEHISFEAASGQQEGDDGDGGQRHSVHACKTAMSAIRTEQRTNGAEMRKRSIPLLYLPLLVVTR